MLVRTCTQTGLVRKDSKYISTMQPINYVYIVASSNRASWARKFQKVKGLQVQGKNTHMYIHFLCFVADRTLCTTLLLPRAFSLRSGNSSGKTAHSTQPCKGQTAPTQPCDERCKDAELSCLAPFLQKHGKHGISRFSCYVYL